MSNEKMIEARDLIKAKRYAEARTILKTVNHPTAHQWLKKIDEIAPEDDDLGDPFAGLSPSASTSRPISKRHIAQLEIELRKTEDNIESRKGQRQAATIVFIGSLILAPVGIGIILLPFSLFNYFRHKNAVNRLQNERQDIIEELAMLRAEIQ